MNALKTYRKHVATSITLIGLLLFSHLSVASSIKQLDIDELLLGSELVFEGTVISKRAHWNATKTDILTDITFEVNDVIVGSFEGSTLTLVFVGGTVDGVKVDIQGSEMPAQDEQGVYFVESTSKSLVNPLLGWAQGHFVMQADESGAMRMMTQNKMAVMSVQTEQLKESYISKGVVTGVMTESVTEARSNNAMLVDDFKSALKAQMQTLTQAPTEQ